MVHTYLTRSAIYGSLLTDRQIHSFAIAVRLIEEWFSVHIVSNDLISQWDGLTFNCTGHNKKLSYHTYPSFKWKYRFDRSTVLEHCLKLQGTIGTKVPRLCLPCLIQAVSLADGLFESSRIWYNWDEIKSASYAKKESKMNFILSLYVKLITIYDKNSHKISSKQSLQKMRFSSESSTHQLKRLGWLQNMLTIV